ncbi:MAG: ABC transporter substrate-binding protein [Actinobacteria bacterium]|nr:ABC transporter substrate-binding protein [Actinomycetota bacterium]
MGPPESGGFSVKRFTSIAALTAFMLTAAACGDDSTTSSSSNDLKIVSLSPTATEMLFAIGAGPQIIAVDDQSNYPAEALDKPHDLSGFEPNVEAIAALKPDLVIMQDPTIQEQLEALGITVWIGSAAASFDDVYTQIEQLGAATEHVGEAAELVSKMQTDIAAAVAAAPQAKGLKVYHELDNTFYSVTSNTFIGQVYAQFGMVNIADEAQPGNDYPQLNAEYIVQQNPDLVFLADTKCCGESPETAATRPGWDALAAVQNEGVIGLDDDIASRWGPRLVDFITAVSDAVAKVPAA